MMLGIGEQARNRWRSILSQLGVSAKYLTGKQGPCPVCGGTDRFRFDDKEGRGTFYCNHCGPGDGVQMVMLLFGMSFRDAAEKVRELIPGAEVVKARKPVSTEERVNALKETWKASRLITADDEAGRYLLNRGFAEPFSPALRFIPRLRVTNEAVSHLAAMIALVKDPEGAPCNLHRTYLQNAEKAKISSPRRMMPGETPIGSYIEISAATEEMGVAEGIETALAVQRDFGIPCWSLISADGLKAFTPPVTVKRLRIFGDNDGKYAGQAAAFALAHRIATKFDWIETSVEIPPQPGSDWADRQAA